MKNDNQNRINDSAKIYYMTNIINSKLEKNTVVGDFTKIEDAELHEFARVDRNNYIYKSILGRHSYTGRNTKIIKADVGNFSSISWDVTIGGANHDYSKITTHSFLYNNIDNLRPENVPPVYNRFEQNCTIGNDVWIGAGAIVLRGIKIDNGAVVAAGAVVTKDVPPYAIVAGVPAKIVSFRFNREKIEKLQKVEWWNWSDEKIKKNFNFFMEK